MLIRGPFVIKWGDNEIGDIESIKVEHKIDSTDLQTVQGKTFEVDGPFKASATITLLATDLAVLAVVLPQHFVHNGGKLSTGETVNNADGAIDIKPHACDEDLIYNHLDIISCANPGQVVRIVHARTKLDGIDIDNKIQKVMVKFVGEAESDEATLQFFKEGTIHTIS